MPTHDDVAGQPRIAYVGPEPLAGLVEFVRTSAPAGLITDLENVLLAESADDILAFAKARPAATIEARTSWMPSRTSIQSVVVSGYENSDQGRQLAKGLLADAARLPRQIERLHVHLQSAISSSTASAPAADSAPPDLYERITEPIESWRDLIVPDEVVSALRRNLELLKGHDTLERWGVYRVPGFARRRGASINLIGPSGTGKSMAARVIAHELGRQLLIVDYSQLESKYVGETSKHIREVFQAARESGDNAVLFFDEADSFLSSRVKNAQQSYDVAVNNSRAVMLLELEAFEGVVIFATNLISNYDPAFRRRILAHVEFPLPDANACSKIIESHMPLGVPGREALDFAAIGQVAVGLSGGELANAVFESCLNVLLRSNESPDTGRITSDDLLTAIRDAQRARELVPDKFRSALPESMGNVVDLPVINIAAGG